MYLDIFLPSYCPTCFLVFLLFILTCCYSYTFYLASLTYFSFSSFSPQEKVLELQEVNSKLTGQLKENK